MRGRTTELAALHAHAVNDVTREIMRDGIALTHEQADELGGETLDWMRDRLGLNVTTTEDGVDCVPPKHYVGRDENGQLVTAEDVP